METKNEQQKQNLIWIFITLALIIICSLLFIQNKKIERIMAITNANYDPYGFNFGIRRRPNSDIRLIENRINEQFLEFAREMDELKRIVSDIMNEYYKDDNIKNDNKVDEKKDVFESSSKEGNKKDKLNKKTKKQKKSSKKSKNKRKNNYKNSQFEVETDYDEDDKEYEVEIKLPNDFTMDDVSINLKNSILTIKIEKEFSKEDKNSSYYNYGSFYQSFTIPKTKATTKDIKKKVENGKLEIKVPIK